MLTHIDHIGIAVKSIEACRPHYEKTLGLHLERIEVVESQKVKTAFYTCGQVHLELLEPTADDSTVAKFIAERGEGVHHIAFYSNSITGDLANAKANGTRLIHEVPFDGAAGKLVAFLHPKSTFGVLTEFCASKA
jgi:methylmalonyl-CoA/ethylmalonyl-CoA epimerase